jgi:hypothetical protein
MPLLVGPKETAGSLGQRKWVLGTGIVAQVAECLLSKHEALNFNPQYHRKRRRRRRVGEEKEERKKKKNKCWYLPVGPHQAATGPIQVG